MPTIHYAGQDVPVRHFPVQPGESVLDCLLRNGIAISHSCKAGACQSCLVKAGSPVPETAQRGLKDTLRAQNYFLACSLQPAGDFTVSPAGAEQRIQARITGIDALNDSVLRVRLRTEVPFEYRAGQFVSLFREDGLARSYSLASLPGDDALELHVRKIPGGAMSGWLHSQALHAQSLDRAQPDVPVWIQGPSGNCFYVPGKAEEPLLLAGAGTGLAPLFGIARDALQQGHSGPIWLFHGALTPEGLYLTTELIELCRAHANFHCVRSVLQDGDSKSRTGPTRPPNQSETLWGRSPTCPRRLEACATCASSSNGVEVGDLDRCILARFPNLSGWKGYVCGDPALVNLLRKKMFLAGMASKAIYADAFLPSAPAFVTG